MSFFYQRRKIPYKKCLAHHLIGILASDGSLYPCWNLQGIPDYSYGSIYRKSFSDLWYGEKRQNILKKIAKGECSNYCLGKTSFYRYDYYNRLLEYLTSDKDKVGHINFL